VKGLNQPLFHEDNARSQTARVTTDYPQEKNNVTLLPRSARSPDLSPIEENVWDVIGTYEKYNDMGQLFLGF
jgi:hypothetical protein